MNFIPPCQLTQRFGFEKGISFSPRSSQCPRSKNISFVTLPWLQTRASMPTPFKFTVKLNISRRLLWRIRATKTFMNFLVSDGALNRMDATVAKTPSDTKSTTMRTRKQTYVPGNVAIPDIIKPIIDDSYIEITDSQTWDEAIPYVQKSVVHPTILGDVITTTATLTMALDNDCVANGDVIDGDVEDKEQIQSCLHTLSGNVTVSIPFLGYYVEQAVVSNMKQFYSTYADHVANFVEMTVKKYGDGTRSSLPQAIDRLLAEEKTREV